MFVFPSNLCYNGFTGKMRVQSLRCFQILQARVKPVKTKYGKRFDWKYSYSGNDLGAICSAVRTVFKVWCPEADRVELFIYWNDASPVYRILPLRRRGRGVWAVTVEGDLHGVYYDYLVETDGLPVHTADPYARACGRNGVRSMAVDLARTNPETWWRDAPPPARPENII